MKYMIILASLILYGVSFAQDAETIIERIDRNQSSDTSRFKAVMVIKDKGRTMEKRFSGASRDNGRLSYLVFTNPEDDGVKYLKIKDQLWIYFPDADDVMKISGHMLKRGMMGSDISYEDMLETESMSAMYKASMNGEKTVNSIPCHIVELSAVKDGARYEKQILYVDKERPVPLLIKMYARGGRLVRTIEQDDITVINGKHVPLTVRVNDARKTDSGTTITFTTVEYGVQLPGDIFTRQNLRK
ncbi:MAG: outer membrane lipoprotein-sorting protein [Spirochaetota bacterium]